MNININLFQFKIFIFIIAISSFKIDKVKSQSDQTCIQNLVNKLFNYQNSISLCTDSSGLSPEATWSYISNCSDSTNLPDKLTIVSRSLNSNYLTFADLSCFSALSNISLTNLTFETDAFGTGTQGIAKNVFLYTCSFKDPLISASSISSSIEHFYIKINDQLNLPQISFSAIKTLKSFELVHDISVVVQNYVTFINDLSPGDTDFSKLTLTSNQIPSFVNIKASDLYFNLVQASLATTFDSFNTLSQVIGLYFAFNFDGNSHIDYPTSLSLATNLDELTITGQLNQPTTTLDLPVNLKKLSIGDSPSFNQNGNLPFILPTTLTTITISDLGLTSLPTFPSDIESIYFENNVNLNSNLPVLSSYSKLTKVSLINCGYYSSIPNSYCNFNQLDLSNNSLDSSVPQCLVCYKNEVYNDFDFSNNPSLVIGTCEKGSIIPNLYINEFGQLEISGQNLGTMGPTIMGTSLVFQVVQLQSLFTVAWDESTYGPLPDTIQLKFGDNIFTLATKVLNPLISNITKVGDLYTFRGSNLSYNKDDIQLKISNIECTVVSIDFNSIQCSFKDKRLPVGQDISATIQNIKYIATPSEIVYFTVNTAVDKTTIVKTCSSNCNIDLGQGKCSSTTGLCICTTYYYGSSCETPSPFLSSISSVSNSSPLLVSLYGWFGNGTTANNMTVLIGDSYCKVHYVDLYFSNCTIDSPSGNGTVSVTLEFQNLNGYTWYGRNIFHYSEPFYKCPNNCSNHGKCNRLIGQCVCNLGYGGYNCNSKIPIDSSSASHEATPTIPKSNSTINESVGSAIINNQDTFFEISIISLVELDIYNNIVSLYNLTNNWNVTSSNSNDSNESGRTYTFQQPIQETCLITYNIQEIKEPQIIFYAGLNFTLDKDSIKMSVLIQNYSFVSALNQLQLRIQSSVETNSSSEHDNTECNQRESQVDTSLVDKDQLLNYVLVSKNNKILNAVFINRVESDSRSSFITNSIISNKTKIGTKDIIVIGLNLPHCTHECFIDPHFSVVLDELFKDICILGRPSWVLLVSIFIPCGFLVVMIVVASIIFRQHRTFWLIKVYNLKEFTKNLTRSSKEYIYMPNRSSF